MKLFMIISDCNSNNNNNDDINKLKKQGLRRLLLYFTKFMWRSSHCNDYLCEDALLCAELPFFHSPLLNCL